MEGSSLPTSIERDARVWIAQARSLVYCVLALVFDAEGGDGLEALSTSPEVRESFEVLCGEEGRRLLESVGDLDRFEYAALFIGPGRAGASPWESSYRSKDGLVMGRTTLSVAESYRAAGYESIGHGRVPDDHIAAELFFMASLCRDEGTEAEQLSFLEGHLGMWVGDFADRVKQADASSVYAAAAAIVADFVGRDKNLVAELVAALPLHQKEGSR